MGEGACARGSAAQDPAGELVGEVPLVVDRAALVVDQPFEDWFSAMLKTHPDLARGIANLAEQANGFRRRGIPTRLVILDLDNPRDWTSDSFFDDGTPDR